MRTLYRIPRTFHRLCETGEPGESSLHPRSTALIAADEPLLRQALKTQLSKVWPELEVIAEARNGREAIELFEACIARGFLIYRSGFLPRFSGLFLALEGFCYLVSSFANFLAPTFAQQLFCDAPGVRSCGSAAVPLALLVRGVNVARWQERAQSVLPPVVSGFSAVS